MAETGARPPSKEEDWLRTILKTGEFKDDLKRLGKGVHRAAILEELPGNLALLANDQPLPAALRDHALSGNYGDSRDLHIRAISS